METFILLGRLLFGGFFVYNGMKHLLDRKALTGYAASKKVPFAELSVILSGLLILFSGAGIVLGIYMEVSLALVSIFLLAVTFAMHGFWLDKDQQARQMNKVQFAKNVALLGACLMMLGLYVK